MLILAKLPAAVARTEYCNTMNNFLCFRLADQWVPLDEVTARKTVKISNLPEKSKQKLNHQLLFQPERRKQSRKTKRQDNYNLFLTPDEVKRKEALLEAGGSS